MRISKPALLVVLALLAPVVVELRTFLVWFGIELTVEQSVAISALLVAIVLGWAFWPASADAKSSDK